MPHTHFAAGQRQKASSSNSTNKRGQRAPRLSGENLHVARGAPFETKAKKQSRTDFGGYTAAALDTMTRDAGVSHEITLREEEVRDISLATFHVFDKEGAKALPSWRKARHPWPGLLPVRVFGRAEPFWF